jgi:hypothetical protein
VFKHFDFLLPMVVLIQWLYMMLSADGAART